MNFSTQTTPDGATRITVEGDLGIYHAAEIKQQLIDGLRAHPVLELDLSHVGEMDTAGFQLLALAKEESRAPGLGPAHRRPQQPRCAKSSSFSTWLPTSATRW
jgi:anti-anti-sigma regulatory factor